MTRFKTVVAFAAVLFACSPANEASVVIDLSRVSAALASGQAFGPGAGGAIRLSIAAPDGSVVSETSRPLGESVIELKSPAGIGMTVMAVVAESDAFGETVYYSGSAVADLLPGAQNAVGIELFPAVAVEPRAASVKLSQSAVFTAAAEGMAEETLVWSVNAVAGGGTADGVITQTNPATYYAPRTAPASAAIVVSAKYTSGTTSFVGGAFVTLVANDRLPSISGFTPNSGPPGTLVTISGSDFGTGGNVLFGGVAADSIASWTDAEIVAAVPTAAVTGTIMVRTSEGTAESLEAFTVTYPAPVISGFSPPAGSPGTAVTIAGRWFGTGQGASAVYFGGVKADTVYVWTETEVRTAVPRGSSSGKISIATESGTAESSNSFTVLPSPPVITAITPASGFPGDEVALSGRDFGDGAGGTAGFAGADGPVRATSTLWTDTEIRLTVPDKAASGPVWVTTPGGTAESSGTFAVRPPAPVINGLSPSVMSNNTTGFALSVAGQWFVDGSAVEVGGVAAETVFKNDRELSAAVTADMVQTAGDVFVTVVNPGGMVDPEGTVSNSFPLHVYAGAALNVASVTVGQSSVSTGQTAVPVIVKVKNSGEAPARIASLALALTGQAAEDVSADFTVASQFKTSDFLAGGAEKQYAFTLGYSASPAYTGTVAVSPVVGATDGYSGVAIPAAPAQTSFAAQRAAAVAVREISVQGSGKATLGQTKQVSVTFENTGAAPASVTAAALTFVDANGNSRAGDFTATPNTLFPADLAGGASLAVVYAVQVGQSAQTGDAAIDVAASAIDQNTRAAVTVAPAPAKGSLTVQTPPSLSVSAVNLSKQTVNLGQTGLQLSATVHNAGGADATVTSLQPVFKDAGNVDVSGDYIVTPTGSFPFTLAGGADASFPFQVSVKPGAAKGSISAGATGTATDANNGTSASIAPSATAQWTVQTPASLNVLNVTPSSGVVHVLDSWLSVAVTVENNGDSQARVTGIAVKFKQGANDVTSSFAPVLQTSLPAVIAGQSTQQFTFDFTAPAGTPVGTTVIDAGLNFEDLTSGLTDTRPGAQSPATVEVRHKLTVAVSSPASWVYAGGSTVQLTHTVKDENGNDAANTAVTWSVEGGLPVEVGTISGTGLYTPPAKALKGTATIRASSVEDGAFSGTASITLKHVLTVTVTPAAKNVYVDGANTVFSAVVKDETGAVHATPVSWAVLGGTAAEVGTIDPANGTYTAPARRWVATGTVRATSQEDTGFSGDAALTFLHTYTVDVTPKDISMYVRASPIQFSATVLDDAGQAAPQGVNWSVEGGTAQQVGTVDALGWYVPPSFKTVSPATIRATSKDDPAFSYSTTVTLKHILTVTVTPSNTGVHTNTQKQFAAEIRDEGGAVHGTGVAWTLVEVGNVGSINLLTGLYTAPVSTPDPGVTVKAVSNEDPTASGTAAVTLWDGPPSMYWESAASRLNPGQGYGFIAPVSNATDTTVAFFVNGIAGGNAQLGTIDAAGAYQAPYVLPPSPTVTVKAVSNEDPTVFIEQEVIIAIGLYQARYRLDVNESTFSFNATLLDGNNDLEILGGSLFANPCGAGCVAVDIPLNVRSISQSQYDGCAVSFNALPAQVTLKNLSGGSTAGPVGCAATATVFAGTLAPAGALNPTLSFENTSAATTYSIDIEIGSDLPYLYDNGPYGGTLNDPVALTGAFLGNSPAAAEGNRVVINGFTVPEGSVTNWSDVEIDFVVPVGASTGLLDVFRNGFKVFLSGQAFSFGQQTIVSVAGGASGEYQGGPIWVDPAGTRIFYGGLVPSVNGGLFTDTIPATAPVLVHDTTNFVTAIHVSGADMFYSGVDTIYQKASGDLNPGVAQTTGFANLPEYGLATHSNMLFWAGSPEGFAFMNATYGAQFIEGMPAFTVGPFLYGADATSDGKAVFAYNPGTPTVAYVDSALPDTAVDAGTIVEPLSDFPGYRAFWLNPADDSVLFQFDNGVDGPGLYKSPISPWTPVKVMAITFSGQGELLTAVVNNGKFYYLMKDAAAGYVMLKWKELAGAGEGTIAYVEAGDKPAKHMVASAGYLYYGCRGNKVCRSALVP